jgi:hypothetical protein
MSLKPLELFSDFASKIRKGNNRGATPSLKGELLIVSPRVRSGSSPMLDRDVDRSFSKLFVA